MLSVHTPIPLPRSEVGYQQLASIIGHQGVLALESRSQHLARMHHNADLPVQKIFFDLTGSLLGLALAAQLLQGFSSVPHVL